MSETIFSKVSVTSSKTVLWTFQNSYVYRSGPIEWVIELFYEVSFTSDMKNHKRCILYTISKQ